MRRARNMASIVEEAFFRLLYDNPSAIVPCCKCKIEIRSALGPITKSEPISIVKPEPSVAAGQG